MRVVGFVTQAHVVIRPKESPAHRGLLSRTPWSVVAVTENICIPSIVSMSLRDSKTTPQTFKKFTKHADTFGSVTAITDLSGHSDTI